MVKIVKNPGNGRLNNLNDPVLNVLSLVVLQHDLYFRKLIFLAFRFCNAMSQN